MLFILRAATDNMIKLLAFALLGAIYTANGQDCQPTITTVSGSYAPQQVCAGYLIFEDNFDNFDLNRWAHEINLAGGGNFEFQWYTNERTNSYTQDGVLHIKPTLLADEKGEDFLYSGTIDLGNDCTDSYNNGCRRTGTSTNILNPIKSARIRTLNSFSFRYGKVEVRAKVPAGDWLWPAIWMLPTDWAYGNWPVSGEQDIMESRGNRQFYSGGTNIGVTQMGSTLHWGPDTNNNKFMMTHWEQNLGNGYDQDFHRYQLEWTDNYIKFSVDDAEIGRVAPPDGGFWQYGNLDQTGLPNPWQGGNKMAPFDKQFHLIINLAIGGTNYFPDTAQNGNGQKPWSNTSPTAMTDFWKGNGQWKPTWNMGSEDSHLKVDYVRVWAL